MKKTFVLDPRNIFVALDAIDQQHPSYTLTRHDSLRRIFWTLACVCVCLLLIHYMKYFSSFSASLKMLA